jgi:hypothetical protein
MSLVIRAHLGVYSCELGLHFIRTPVLVIYHVEVYLTQNMRFHKIFFHCLLYYAKPKDNELYTQDNLLARGSLTYKWKNEVAYKAIFGSV